MRSKQIPLLLLVLFMATSCGVFEQAKQIDCDTLTAADLRNFIKSGIMPDDLLQWLASTYQLDQDTIRTQKTENGSTFFWPHDGIDHTLYAPLKTHPYLDIFFTKPMPSVEQLIACLGPPEQYSARYFYSPHGVNSLVLYLFYPSEGVTAVTSVDRNLRHKEPPPIEPRAPVERLTLVHPGPFDEFVRRTVQAEELADLLVRTSKPWPGSWEQIEIDLGPFLESD